MNTLKELDLILIGKTGNGKSATGNSILLKDDVFESTSGSKSVTKIPQYEWIKFEDRVIQVVDAPGVIDTDSNEHEDIKLMQGAMEKVMLTNPEGYHAFLIVVKYGARFTNEEQKAILLLKGILGLDFLKNFGIVVMCNGDQLKRDQKKRGITSESYCKTEEGPLKQLLEECNGRIVVFDNVTENDKEKYQQVKNLVVMVDQLRNGGIRYTNHHFEKAGDYRKHMYITSKLPMIEKETLMSQRLILDEIQNTEHETDEKVKIERLEKLLPEICLLLKSIKIKDKGTGALNVLLKNVEGTYQDVTGRIAFIQKSIKNKDEMKAREERLKRETEEKIRQEKEKLEKEKLEELKRMEENMKKEKKRLKSLAADKEKKLWKKLEEIEEQRREEKEFYARRENEIKRKADEERAALARETEKMMREKEKFEKEKLEELKRMEEKMETERERLKKLASDEAEKLKKKHQEIKEQSFFRKQKEVNMDSSQRTDLLLIGKTGNGKSSTGNSILNRHAFITSDSFNSVTQEIKSEVSVFNGRAIKVVDAPGTNDTQKENETEAIQLVQASITKAISENPEGFHAFLIILKYGNRVTKEEKLAIEVLKGILGNDFLKDFGVIVMCGGDTFEYDHKGETFQNFCLKQTGDFLSLLEECNNRIVLFNNHSMDEAVKLRQRQNLFTMVDQLKYKGKRYTNVVFEKAQKTRDLLYVQTSKPIIEKEMTAKLTLCLDFIKDAQTISDAKEQIERLKKVLLQIEQFKQEIITKDKGTRALQSLLDQINKHKNVAQCCIESNETFIKATQKNYALEQENEKQLQQIKNLEFENRNIQQRAERENDSISGMVAQAVLGMIVGGVIGLAAGPGGAVSGAIMGLFFSQPM